jgi:hypothetical protein
VYVIQQTSEPQLILQFSATANGAVTPVATLNVPAGMAIGSIATDATGDLYVGGLLGSQFVIEVYAPGASGSALPIRTIELNFGAYSLAVDSAGQLYVAASNNVAVYSPTANGLATPVRLITGPSTGLTIAPFAIAVDSVGGIYVANSVTISIFSPGANGNAPTSRVITPPSPWEFVGVAVDKAGNVYASEDQYLKPATIVEFAPNSTGAATPVKSITASSTGPGNGLGLQLDSAGNLYMINEAYIANSASTPSIFGFGPTASGDVQPAVNFTSTSWNTTNNVNFALQ